MKLEVLRTATVFPLNGNEPYTQGIMYYDGLFFGYTVEDADRHLESGGGKVYGLTAIPRGTYKVVVTPSPHFGDKLLPEVLNVPGFSGIRIHGGNRAEDSLGCIILGKVRTVDGVAQCADLVQSLVRALIDDQKNGKENTLEVL